MTITTVDGIIAGAKPPVYFHKALSGNLLAGRPHTPIYTAGIPGAAVANASGLSGAALTSYAGQLSFTNPGSGNTHLTRLAATGTQNGTLMLVDRLWHSGDVGFASGVKTINSVAWPARDADGTTAGKGVMVGLEISTATGAGTPVPVLTYTNNAGTSGQTASPAFAYGASSIQGSFYPFALAAGDVGVQSIQSLNFPSTMTSGVIHLVAYRVLAMIDIGTNGGAAGPLELGLPRMFDNTVPQLIFVPSATTSTFLAGTMSVTQG